VSSSQGWPALIRGLRRLSLPGPDFRGSTLALAYALISVSHSNGHRDILQTRRRGRRGVVTFTFAYWVFPASFHLRCGLLAAFAWARRTEGSGSCGACIVSGSCAPPPRALRDDDDDDDDDDDGNYLPKRVEI
jgi:hypothetical protein